MNCCDNINIGCKNYEKICVNCGTIHDYKYVNETSFRDYNMNMSNMLFYKKLFINGKNIYMKNFFLLFFDNSLEDIRNLYNLKRISISKYLNSIYKFYCNKSSINYQPIFKNKKLLI